MTWSACEACPHKKPCWSSRWNGGSERPPGNEAPEEGEGLKNLTCVHTCFTCGERVFDTFDTFEGERRPIPEGCPRWNPMFGSATDCNGCNADRETVRRAHPNHERRMDAAKGALEAIFGGVKAKKEGDELGARRAINNFATGFTKADNPLNWLPGMLVEHPELVPPAEALLGAAVASVLNHKDVIPEWSRHEDWQQSMFLGRWSEAAILAIQQNPGDPEKAVWEMWLAISDTPAVRRGLGRGGKPSERELMRKGWVAQLSKVWGV